MGVALYGYRSFAVVPDADIAYDEDGELTYRGKRVWDTEGMEQTFVYTGLEHGLEGITDAPEVEGVLTRGPWVMGADRYVGDAHFSYGGYGVVRNALSLVFLGVPAEEVWADPDAYRDKPMFDLIHFADNEGVLGPVSCGRIRDAFVAAGGDGPTRFKARFEGWPQGQAEANYDTLYSLFVHAADTGLVALH